MRCGQILLAEYPFTDHSGSKVRPVVVVSASEFNRGFDFVVVPVSSAPEADDPHAMFLDDADTRFKETRLRQSSSIKWTKPMTISQRVVVSKLGHLPADWLHDVHERVRGLLNA